VILIVIDSYALRQPPIIGASADTQTQDDDLRPFLGIAKALKRKSYLFNSGGLPSYTPLVLRIVVYLVCDRF
jgi:hypothetical protein